MTLTPPRLTQNNPKLIRIVTSMLKLCPPALGYVRRALFYSHPENLVPTSLFNKDKETSISTAPDMRTIFVDVSTTTRHNRKTGLNRVTEKILRAWSDMTDSRYCIVPVYSDGRKFYRFSKTRAFLQRRRKSILFSYHEEIHPVNSDIVILLDLDTNYVPEMESYLRKFRQRGVLLYAVIYDLIPVLYPDSMPDGFVREYPIWLNTVLRQADGVIAISRAVATDILNWIYRYPPGRQSALAVGFFHIGADFSNDAARPTHVPMLLDPSVLALRPSILMVSTLEPRKGYDQALAAFEQLWADGIDVNLVIVGRAGWKVEPLLQKIRAHTELGRRLFWLNNADDHTLGALYKSCSALLSTSICEGFGLPLVEASHHELPVIARDIPVFREIMEDQAHYFSGNTSQELADAIKIWLTLFGMDAIPKPKQKKWLTWEQSAKSLIDLVLEADSDGWIRQHHANHGDS